MRLRRTLATLSVAGLATVAAGVGSGQATTVPNTSEPLDPAFDAQWEELIAAAQEEGEISVVSGPEGIENDGPFFEAFGERFGLEVSQFGGATDEVTGRVSAERSQGIYDYDVGNLGGSGTANFLEADFFEEILPLMIHPDFLELKNFATDFIPWEPEQGTDDPSHCLQYAVESEGNFISFYINTETVSEEDYESLNSWFDLHDPRWNGRIVIGDIASGESSSDRNLAWTLLGQEWFDGLLANDPIIVPYGSAREHADILIRGDADIALFSPGDQSMQEAIDQGLPVMLMDKTMTEGSPRNLIQRVCVMKDAPHPAAAQLFVNWVFTEEGGTIYNETILRTGRSHIRMDVPMGNIDPLVFERAHDVSIPIIQTTDPEFLEADAAADAYLQQKFEELDLVPGN